MDSPLQTGSPVKRRILCIDGGGLLGTFPAAFLTELEKRTDRPIGSYFDLIAGTSTGGIIAIGLGLGLRAAEILKLYEERGPWIFGQDGHPAVNRLRRRVAAVRHFGRAKHSATRLREALAGVLGERQLGEATTRLVVPAWSSYTRSVYIYKTAHHPRFQADYETKAVDVAMATASAPTYFPHHITENSVGLVDGGVWANNPIAIAVVEAISILEWAPQNLHVLSLGCLDKAYALPHSGGKIAFKRKFVRLFMDGQDRGAMGMAKLITGDGHDRQAIYRINHVVENGTHEIDDARVMSGLKGLGFERAREHLPAVQRVFLNEKTEPFTPFHTLPLKTKECHEAYK